MKTLGKSYNFTDIPLKIKNEILDIQVRKETNPIKEAKRFSKVLKQKGVTQEALSVWSSIKRSYIASSVRLLQLPEEVQTMLYNGKITVSHAKLILSVPAEARLRFANEIVLNKWDVRKTQLAAKQIILSSNESTRLSQKLYESTQSQAKLIIKENGSAFVTFAFSSQSEALSFLSKVENRILSKAGKE